MQYRDLDPAESQLARQLLESIDLDDQLHHFQREMSQSDFDAWEERARSHRLIGCFIHGDLVGLAELAPETDQAECSLFVTSAHRRKGIGTALFRHACDAASENGAHFLTILVTRGDAEMLDLAARNDGLSVFRHGSSAILPAGDHPTARWLIFELDHMPAESWFSQTVRRVRENLDF